MLAPAGVDHSRNSLTCLYLCQIGAEMIIMGCRGLGSVKRLLLGSASTYVSHHASMPVLVVREKVPGVDSKKVEPSEEFQESTPSSLPTILKPKTS